MAKGDVLERKTLAIGDVLFKEGDEATCAYIVQDGEVEIFKGSGEQPAVLGVVKKGGIIGEMGLIDQKPRMASARALKPTTVILVTRDMMNHKIAKADPFIRALLGILIDDIRRLTK